ncbi:protein CLT2, chloroplastic [Sesamum angolense]|uniref:Protein CLT2, chloroplastic n=1 Tax=Sesamum angolense TaxID=2727404 RepID=A0AAE1W6N1_9LAMI|nr:protein CLT2, chloroplastic [Sesamum angolense]
MKLLTSEFSVVSAAVNGSNYGALRIGSVPTRLLLRLQPLRLSVSNVKLSICKNNFDYRKTTFIRFQHLVPCALAKSSSPDGPPSSYPSAYKKLAVVIWTAITLVLAVGNRVLHKLALVPMKDYPLFLAQFNSLMYALIHYAFCFLELLDFHYSLKINYSLHELEIKLGNRLETWFELKYVAVFFSVLHVRYHAGLTTDEMLTIPKAPFIVIGLLESISVVSGMYAGAMLPGPAILLLYQTFLVWQLIFSRIILRRSYTLNQIVGCFLVAAGVIVAVTSAHDMFLCFSSRASIVKGKSLDIFVVHSFGSGFQALFVLPLLPILSKLKGVPLSEAPSYFKSGAACFLNIGTNTTDPSFIPPSQKRDQYPKVQGIRVPTLSLYFVSGCDGAPLLPILYIISNLLFKISNLNLLKVSNAIVASLAVRSSVPIAIYLLSVPLPYLPKGVSLSPFFHLGSVILVLGLILYNIPWPWEQAC